MYMLELLISKQKICNLNCYQDVFLWMGMVLLIKLGIWIENIPDRFLSINRYTFRH